MEDTKTVENKKTIKFITFLAIVTVAALTYCLYKTGFFQLYFSKECILSFLESLGPWSFLGFILLQASQVVLAPIPGEVTGLIGGYLFGLPLGVLLSTTGLVLGSYVAFALSRAFGRPLVEKLVNQSVTARFDYLLHHKGVLLVFMLFILPGFPKDYLCFILGLGHLSTFEFLIISGVGRLFGTILLTLGGGYIRYEEYDKLIVLVGVSILVALIFYIFRERVERLLKYIHLAKSGEND